MIRRTALPALAAVAALAGCGGGTSSPGTGGTEPGSSATSTTSASVPGGPGSGPSTVDGVRLTAQGSALKLGETARVTWQPDQRTVGVIALSVTRLDQVPIRAFSDWRLNRATQRSTPYFVHATVRNLGRSDLSGTPVPLYLLDQHNTLLRASTFRAEYRPCPSRPLPKRFTHGKKTSVCLVYFVPHHGRLVAVSFRPSQQFQAITWKGKIH